MGRTQVFISYARKNKRWLERVETHLGVLAREGQIDIWDDQRLEAGEVWLARLNERMSHAGIAVLLISPDFLNSEFILTKEVPALFKRHEADGMRLYPLLIEACAWDEVGWLKELQIRPQGDRPVSGFRSDKINVVLTGVAREIANWVRNNAAGGRQAPPEEQAADSKKTRKGVSKNKTKRTSK